MGYLTKEEATQIDYLIECKDVAIGAAYEVYLENMDIEDLTHSLLVILKNCAGFDSSQVNFSYREKEKQRMQKILKKLPYDIDKDKIFVSLSRSRKIIDFYQEIIQNTQNENPATLRKLADRLVAALENAQAQQKSLAASLRDINPVERRKSFKEIRDEMQVVMTDYKEDLIEKDTEVIKSVCMGEDENELASVYEELQKLNEKSKIVSLLNKLIESYFSSK